MLFGYKYGYHRIAVQSLDINGYLWITLWDNATGYHMRILKDTYKDIYGYIKVMQVGYS